MKKIALLGLISIVFLTANGQFIDNYGLKLGAGLSNQYWDYKNDMFSSLSGWKDNKIGFFGQVYAEKNIGKYISFRPALGYLQKGFVDDITLTTAEGEELAIKDNKVVFHDLSLDLSLKIIPFEKNLKPYIFLGLRGDYLMDYRSVIVDFQGEEYELDTELYDNFNKFNLGAVFGFGISYKDLLFLDLEYNPSITKNYESSGLAINDKYFSLTVGLNINKLILIQK
ncbi:MAG: porin family protein [Bacilli bacterium]